MVSLKALMGICAAAVVAVASNSVFAAPVYSQLGNTGTLQVTTYQPTLQVTSATVASPYGTSAPAITALPGGSFQLKFTLDSSFFAAANNAGGGEKDIMAGKLDFQLTFDSPILLTTNIKESGIFSETGVGDASVFAGAVITAVGGPAEQVSSGLLGSNAAFNPANNTWSASDVISGFQFAHTTYQFTIDNDLIAFAPTSGTASSAAIAKKEFTIIVGGPNIPEPASLSLLAIGGVALIARRRRA